MSEKPIVTIVVPTKNRRALLRECLESVARQTFDGWECVVVDDGSDDGTGEELAALQARDPRFRYLVRNSETSGANACRNLGARESKSNLLVFLDSDDLLAPNCLQRRCEVMTHNADLDFAVWRTGAFQSVPGDLGRDMSPEILGDDLLRFLFMECPWQTTAPIWRKKALMRVGGWDETLPSWQDVDLHIRAICMGQRYLRFPEVDHYMRSTRDPERTSNLQRKSPDHLTAALLTLEKFEKALRNGPGIDWVRQRALCSLYFFVAERWVEVGSVVDALETWRQARARGFLPLSVYATGTSLLLLKRMGNGSEFVRRLINKWIGFVRMRTNAELVSQ